MEEDWASTTDPKEKKRIQNRVAQRVHREKLKSRIRQLEEQLESVSGALTQNDTSKPLASYNHPTLSFAPPGVLSTTNSEPRLDRVGTSSSDITFVGNHAPKLLLGSDIAVESGFNAVPQASILAQLDSLSRNPVEVQPLDFEWLLTDSEALKTVLERAQAHSPPMERGHKNQENIQSPLNKSLPRHCSSSDQVRAGGNSGQSAHKMTTAPMAQKPGRETLLGPDVTRLERLSLLVECSRRLGFSNLDEALSVYYTSDLSKSAILSHEQSLNRVRHLPKFLSDVREHSKHWPTWERANYVRETLRSAEDIYSEECRLARINLGSQGIVGLAQRQFPIDQMCQITCDLQQEIPNTWALITSIILHSVMPGEPQQPQTILMVMMLLCYRSQDPITTLGLCQEYLYQNNDFESINWLAFNYSNDSNNDGSCCDDSRGGNQPKMRSPALSDLKLISLVSSDLTQLITPHTICTCDSIEAYPTPFDWFLSMAVDACDSIDESRSIISFGADRNAWRSASSLGTTLRLSEVFLQLEGFDGAAERVLMGVLRRRKSCNAITTRNLKHGGTHRVT